MLVNFPASIEGSSYSGRSQSFLHNQYNVDGLLMPRERMRMVAAYNVAGNTGIEAPSGSNTTSSIVTNRKPRALMVNASEDKLYGIIGDTVYLLASFSSSDSPDFDESEYDFTNIVGTLSSAQNSYLSIENFNDEISWAAGFTGIAFTIGTSQYFIDDNDTLTELFTSSPPFTNCDSVAFSDGRFLWVDRVNRIVFYSEVNDAGNVSATSFFDSETVADETIGLHVIGNELYVYSERSIERFRNTGNASAPYLRVTNSVINVGVISGVIKLEDSMTFIGRDASGSIGAFILAQGRVSKISTGQIDEILNTYTSYGVEFRAVQSAVGTGFSSYGRRVFCFTLVYVRSRNFGSGTLRDFPYQGITLYAMLNNGAYDWGFLSNTKPFVNQNDGLPSSDISDWNESYDSYFDYTEYRFFRGYWHCLRAPLIKRASSDSGYNALDQVGLYVMGNHRTNDSAPTSASSDTEAGKYQDFSSIAEPISRGFKMSIRGQIDKPFQIKSLELAFSKQWGLDLDGSDPDTSDVVNMRIRTEGDYSNQVSRSFGDVGNRGRLRWDVSGGIAQAETAVEIQVETSSDNMIVFEKLIAND